MCKTCNFTDSSTHKGYRFVLFKYKIGDMLYLTGSHINYGGLIITLSIKCCVIWCILTGTSFYFD